MVWSIAYLLICKRVSPLVGRRLYATVYLDDVSLRQFCREVLRPEKRYLLELVRFFRFDGFIPTLGGDVPNASFNLLIRLLPLVHPEHLEIVGPPRSETYSDNIPLIKGAAALLGAVDGSCLVNVSIKGSMSSSVDWVPLLRSASATLERIEMGKVVDIRIADALYDDLPPLVSLRSFGVDVVNAVDAGLAVPVEWREWIRQSNESLLCRTLASALKLETLKFGVYIDKGDGPLLRACSQRLRELHIVGFPYALQTLTVCGVPLSDACPVLQHIHVQCLSATQTEPFLEQLPKSLVSIHLGYNVAANACFYFTRLDFFTLLPKLQHFTFDGLKSKLYAPDVEDLANALEVHGVQWDFPTSRIKAV